MAFSRIKQDQPEDDTGMMDYSHPLTISLFPTPAENGQKASAITPSQSAFPVFALCQPLFVDNKIKNNIWMKQANGEEKEMDKEEFMGEWYNLYNALAFNSVIYLIPPRKGLQDQTYVNCAAYLPHRGKENIIVLSNFTAPGRAGEEIVAGRLFTDLGYKVIKCPYKFEGEPELKYVKDNIYIGGYGPRTEIAALKWIEKKFDAEIIPVQETDPHLYHLDCSVFRIDSGNMIVCADLIDDKALDKIEAVTNIHEISKDDAHAGATNSVRAKDFILNASSLKFMKRKDPKYSEEVHKNTRLEEICNKLGLEVVFIEMSECAKSGAALSCFTMHLNYVD